MFDEQGLMDGWRISDKYTSRVEEVEQGMLDEQDEVGQRTKLSIFDV